MATSKKLHRRNPYTRASTLVLVDDATGGLVSPDIIARFAGFGGTLIRANNVENVAFPQCRSQPKVDVTNHGDELVIVSSIPPLCSSYALDGVEPTFLASAGPTLEWNANRQLRLTYQLPPFSPNPRSAVLEMFNTLTIRLETKSGRLGVLVPDFEQLRYREAR